MTLKYENELTEEARASQNETEQPGISPLYGDEYSPPVKRENNRPITEQPNNLMVLRERSTIDALKYALEVYGRELHKLGYSPITIGTYSSSVGRFIQFLEFGRVIPDREQ